MIKLLLDGTKSKNQGILAPNAIDQILSSHSDMTGWVNLPYEKQYWKESLKWSQSLKKSQNHLCVLGIGGSALGTQAIYDFLAPKKKITFLSNIDGYEFERRLCHIDFRKTHFIAISKSGETSETLAQLAHLLQVLKGKKLSIKEHVSVVTEVKSSSLREIGKKYDLRFLPVPQDVGGRFSVFSNVGLAPLTWAGVNVRQVLEGARESIRFKSELDLLSKFYLKSFEDKLWISVFWIYCEALKTFGLWLEQLWSESLAKKISSHGGAAPRVSTPLVCVGPNDQHSLLQQFVEGYHDKSFLFLRNLQSESSTKIKTTECHELKLFKGKSVGEILGLQAQATRLCLQDKNISTAELQVLDHRPQTIGGLIYFFELLVATMAKQLEINAYNQPGVEEVKKVVLGTLGDLRYSEQALKSET